MNVVLVTPSFRPAIGGLETHVAMLADGLADLGHGVEVLTQAAAGGRPALEWAGRGYLVRRFPAWPRGPHYRISPGLTRHVRRLDGVNVVHTFNYHALTALAGTMTSPVPVVFTPFFHGGSASPFRNALHAPYRRVARPMFATAAKVICATEQEVALLAGRFPDVVGKVAIVPHGVTTSERSPDHERVDHRKVVLAVGRLEPHKQLTRVVEGVATLPPDVTLDIVGDGSDRNAITSSIERCGMGGRVTLTGRIGDDALDGRRAEASAFVSMSTHESYGLALLDAISVGLPCVASDIPAHREVGRMAPDLCTFVAPDASPAAIGTALKGACARPRRRPPALPTWADVARSTCRVYDEALGLGAAGR